MKKADQAAAALIAEARAILRDPGRRLSPFTQEQRDHLLLLVHQGFAIGQAVRQLLELEDFGSALRLRDPPASGPAPHATGLAFVDQLSAAVAPVVTGYYQTTVAVDAVTHPALASLRRLGLRRRQLWPYTNGRVLAAAFATQWTRSMGIRPVSPKELEALVRLTEDRAGPARQLSDAKQAERTVDAWKKIIRKGRAMLSRWKEAGRL